MFQPFGFMATPIPASDADADAYILAVTTAGGTLSAGEETAIQTLFISLKSNSLYTKLSFMHPYVGGVADSNKINALNPGTNDLTFSGGSGFAHSVSGSLALSNDAVAGTGWIGAPTGGDINSYHFSFYTATTNAVGHIGGALYLQEFGNLDTLFNTNALFGWLNGADYAIDAGLSYFQGSNNGGYLTVSQAVMGGTTGIFGASRTSSTDFRAFKNGSQVGSTFATAVNQTFPSFQLMSPGYTNPPNTTGNQISSQRRRIFTTFGQGLTTGEFSTMSTIINTFNTSFGRNTY